MSVLETRLFYTMKMSHLTSLELELRDMRKKLNDLHALEGTAPVPQHGELEHLDRAYINFIATVQELKSAVQPFAEEVGLKYL